VLRPAATLLSLFIVAPLVAYAQNGGSPFDNGFTAIQILFTGTVARVASLVAIVIGGYQFVHGNHIAVRRTHGQGPQNEHVERPL